MMITKYILGSATAHLFRAFNPYSIRNRKLRQPSRMASTLPNLAIFQSIARHDQASTAIIHSDSQESFSYGALLHDVVAAKTAMSESIGCSSLEGERVAFLAENNYDYVVTFLAILANEAIALPLSPSFPANELHYLLEDSEARLLLATPTLRKKAEDVLKIELQRQPVFALTYKPEQVRRPYDDVKVVGQPAGRGGLLLYTSGTTSRPKGVHLTTSVITAQALSLIHAWEYASTDLLLHLLPLHHIHGTINALFTPLLAGSTIEFLFPFNADATWKRLAAPLLNASASMFKAPITFLTAVPTIYNRLMFTHASLDQETQRAARKAISPENLRLNISGSAALPTSTKSAWTDLSHGNVLLERYGMTEVGMALSCGLDPADRIDGSVGWPLPSVEARLVDTETNREIMEGEDLDENGKVREGEIQLRGPTIFTEYWRNHLATKQEFVQDDKGGMKWFKTGDIALRKPVEGTGKGSQSWTKGPMYFIQGRKSVDIIKSGGEKVSALEVERELLSLPQISEAAVVGLPSDRWGQKIAAVVVLDPVCAGSASGGKQWGAMDMRRALRDRIATYKIPQELQIVDSIPRNAMGKINKKMLVKKLFDKEN